MLNLALKNFTADGGVVPAGTTSGYETLSIGFVHVEFEPHEAVTLLMLEAFAGNWSRPFVIVKFVDVIARFQQDPEPLASITVIGRVKLDRCTFLFNCRLT